MYASNYFRIWSTQSRASFLVDSGIYLYPIQDSLYQSIHADRWCTITFPKGPEAITGTYE